MPRSDPSRREARAGFARSWDLPGARPVPRRAGPVIFLAQLLLRPLFALLARRRWIGTEHLHRDGPIIACGNHLGPFDALAYGHLLQANGIAPRFLAKDSLFQVPILGALLRRTRQIPVHRGTFRSGDALASAREALSRGELLMVFPEGTYSRDPQDWPMRARLGAARLALQTGAPLLPIACWGSQELWPRHRAVPRLLPRRELTLRVGEPLWVHRHEGESEHAAAVRCTQELMERITMLLEKTRGQQPPATVHDPRHDEHRPEEGRPVRLIWLPPWLRRLLR